MQVITKFVQDQAGNLMPNATGTLYYAGTDQLVTGLQDIDGAALANPMRSDARGMLQFSAPTGNYDLNVRKGSSTYTVRVQVIDVDEAQQAAASATASADDARESAAVFQEDIGPREVSSNTGRKTLTDSISERAVRAKTLEDMKAISGSTLSAGDIVSVTTTPRAGNFVKLVGDFSGVYSNDSSEAVYVKIDDTPETEAILFRLDIVTARGVSAEWAGADPDNPDTDDAPAISAAAMLAYRLSNQVNLGGVDINSRLSVTFQQGKTYYVKSTVPLGVEGVRIDFGCLDGSANIVGATEDQPENKTAIGFSFDRVYRARFYNINFAGFEKVHEWDTKNVDSATVIYDNCDFHNCGSTTVPAIDTRSYSLSRSTELVFRECRATNTPWLVDSYCDSLRFEGGIYRNASNECALVKADSSITTVGGMFVPYVTGGDARWFDLYDNQSAGTRGISTFDTRFSPEGGGIPVAYSFMSGQDVARNALSNRIVMYGGHASASAGNAEYQNTSIIVLMPDGDGNTLAPAMIGFYGASVRARDGLVKTYNGVSPGKARGRFVIEVSYASQAWLSDAANAPERPLVESVLAKYIVGGKMFNEPYSVPSSSAMNIDVSAAGMNAIINVSGSDAEIVGMSGAYDGQRVEVRFSGNRNTVRDFSSGTRLFLNGGADFETDQFGSITLSWDRAGNKWWEVARSAR